MKGGVVLALVVALAWLGWRVVLPRLWSTAAPAPVALDADPVQEPLEPPQRLSVVRDGRVYVVEKLHAYEASGEVLSTSSYDVTWTNDFADVDLALLWGPQREQMKKKYRFFQMGRWLFWRSETQPSAEERQDITRHMSNNHLIPAEGSRRLATAFRWISKGDHVRIRGALVRITDRGGQVYSQSSVSRDDVGDGACEVVWVDELQIGSRVFR